MQALFTPHFGLMLWTIITFLLVVFILGRFGWGPLIKGLEDRDAFLANQKKLMEEARAASEELKLKYEQQLSEARQTVQEMMVQAKADSDQHRARLLASAKEEAERVLEKGRKDLSNEAERLKEELRKEVTQISLTMAEKIIRKSVDGPVKAEILKDSLKEISEVKR